MSWDALFARRPLGVRLGLAIVDGVHAAMGRPTAGTPAVHVVGTNGKGSTAAMIEHALRGQGMRTGLYTSPHLRRVGERVRIDGEAVPDAHLRASVDTVLAHEGSLSLPRPLSFFELITLAALDVVERANVDVLVAEAGLGGRLDATRMVEPAVVAITSIALDHQEFLGDTLDAIAGEKAAVMRPGVPVFSAPQRPAAERVLRNQAQSTGCPLRFCDPLPRAPEGLPGQHQRGNGAVALAAARVLVPSLGADALDGVQWPGRLQTLEHGGGRLVLDAAHNVAAVEAVGQAIETGDVPTPDVVVFGSQAHKDTAAMLDALEGWPGQHWWVSPSAEVEVPGRVGHWARVAASPNDPGFWAALEEVLARGGTALVCGSHLLVGAVLGWMAAESRAADPQDPTIGPSD